jgi:hypothetical protein
MNGSLRDETTTSIFAQDWNWQNFY